MKRFLMLLALLAFAGNAAPAQSSALGGLVSGDVQKVGFRAFILREAISQNLSGWAVNLSDGRVSFAFYGKTERVTKALEKIAEGPDKADVAGVQTWPLFPQPTLTTFTVYAWTSESRNLHSPRNLVFKKRPDDSILDKDKSKEIYHQILTDAGAE